jgi:ribosomal protein L11 methyltransferase
MASDIDPIAVEVANANIKANNLCDHVRCFESIGFNSCELLEAAPFDLIFANILKRPLIDLAPAMAKHLNIGGIVILSGILVEQAEQIMDIYKTQGIILLDREDIGEWTALTLLRG